MKKIFDKVSHWKDRPKSVFSSSGMDSTRSTDEVDLTAQIILSAARALVEGIEDILSDQSSLSGDMSGFHRLLYILESASSSEEINFVASSRGNGCLVMLCRYTSHSSFVDMCTQATLAPALMHSLRLLRMMEVKNGSGRACTDEESSSPRLLSTAVACERVCTVLAALCAQNITLEQLRPSLTKLLQLPLSPLPESGLHFQAHVSTVVHSLCRSALSSQIVWCLRDSQAIVVMVKSLRELTSLEMSGGTGSKRGQGADILLRGKQAEQKGMWITATSCLVQLLNASDSYSPVLMTEFEACHGYDLLVHIVVHSSRDRGMKIMNVITDLLLGGSREVEKPLMHPPVGAVYTGILKAVLRLDRNLRISWTEGEGIFTGEETVGDLRKVALRIAKKSEEWTRAEYILQNISYSLLTLYSSHAENYHILEPKYHFLPIVTLCLPSFRVVESSFAVLKTIDFVCSEGLGTFPMLAMCASIAVMVQQCVTVHNELEDAASPQDIVQNDAADDCATPTKVAPSLARDDDSCLTPKLTTSMDEKKRANKRLHQSLQYLEDIISREEKYALVFVKEGLKVVLCDHLVKAENYPEFNATEGALAVFDRLLTIVVHIINVHPTVSADVRGSGLLQLSSTLIACPGVSPEFANSLLCVIEKLSLAERDRYETNMEKLMDTLRLARGQRQKMAHVMDCLSRILQHGHERVSEVWQMVDGFDGVIAAISSLAGAFNECAPSGDVAPCVQCPAVVEGDDGDSHSSENLALQCLQASLRCLACALSPRGSEHATQSNRKFFRERVKYPTLTDALHCTGLFSSPFSSKCVDTIFALVSGHETPTGSPLKVANADAMAVVIDIIPLLNESVAQSTIRLIIDHAFGQIDGCQLLSEAGIMRLLVEKFQPVLCQGQHPLKGPLSSLLLTLCGEYLTIVDFASFLRHIVRPDAILSQKSQKLLPLWEVVEKKGIMAGRDWGGVQMLVDLVESSSSRSHGVPFASLGPRASKRPGEDPAHIRIHWSEQAMGKVFPVGNFTFSCWVQMGGSVRRPSHEKSSNIGSEADRRCGAVPVFALRGSSGGVFEVQFDVLESTARIILQPRGKSAEVVSFGVPYISENEWHLVVVTLKKPKRVVTSSKMTVAVFLDGQSIFSDKLEQDIPIQGPGVDIFVGRTLVGDRNKFDRVNSCESSSRSPWQKDRHASADFDSTATAFQPLDRIELMKLWHVGPMLFFEECLSQMQISCIMTKGPTYSGIFQGESPLEDALSTVVTEMLCKCNSTFLDMSTLMESLGLKGMELTVIPLFDEFHGEQVTIHMPACPVPVLAYSASAAHTIYPDNAINKSPFRVTIQNSASDHTAISPAELVNGWHVSQVDSIARCIGALGGPAVLIPLVQVASSEKQLLVALQLIKECIRSDSPNLKYMHTEGYGILSFLISRKPKDMITKDVVEHLFSWCVDRGLKSSNSSVFSILLVDTLSFHHFILNHQIWSICRPVFATQVMDMMRSLVCEDARHAILNAQRLGRLGVVRWILSLASFGMDRAVAVSVDTVMVEPLFTSTEWAIQCRTVLDCAGSRDSKDHFVSTSIYVLRMIMMCHLRQNDLTSVANTVLRSMFGNATASANRRRSSSNAVQAVPFDADPAVSGDDNVQLLSPICTLRVNLLRLLKEVYALHLDSEDAHCAASRGKLSPAKDLSDTEVQSMFLSVLTPRWFMVILEKSTDTATTSFCLRLLGLMLQRDMAFRRNFCSVDTQMKALRMILIPDYASPPPVAVVLPLLALLFQIPIKTVPMPADATPQAMIEIMQKCPGPAISEPDMSEFTLPLFSIVMACFWQAARQGSGVIVRDQNILISTMISQAMVTSAFDSFRDLMHQRVAVETVAYTLLMCSNACDDYGSHIYSTSYDLSDNIQEDYISIDYNGTSGDDSELVDSPTPKSEVRRYRVLSDPAIVFTWAEVRLLSPEGDEMEELLFKMLRNAITKYHSPQTVMYFFLAFPKHMTESFVCGYQVLLFGILRKVLRLVFEEMDVMALQTACNVFTLLVPIARARILYDVVLLDLLAVSVFALDTVSSLEVQNWLGIEKHTQILKDVGASARLFAMLNLHSVIHTSDGWSRRLDTIRCIRSKLYLLCGASFEEVSDVSLVKTRKETDDRRSAIQILEAYSISLFPSQETNTVTVGTVISGKRATTMDSALTTATSDKMRISQMFSLILFLNTHALFLDDEQSMRTEAMRICAALLIHRRQFMFEVLYPQKGKKSNDSPEEFESVESSLYDGFSKLVPGMGGAAAYARQLREVTVEHDGEDARMADFSFWLTDHRAQCDALTTVIDYNTSPLMPHILSPAYSIREIISEKTRHDALNQEDVAHTFWSEEFSLQIDVHISRSRMWLVYGFADIAKGSVFWKQVWCSLQSSPVWGTKPVVRSDGAKEDGGISFSSTWDEEVASLTFTPLSVDNVEEVSAVPWRLDFAEGPEKMRIRLEQDYNEEMTGDHDEVDEKNGDVSEANAVAEEVVEEESYDMEEFFKRMSQNKFLRKVSASIDEQEGQFVDELTDMIDDQVLVEEEEEEVDSDRDECESGDDEDAEGERGGEIPDLKITPRTTNFTGDDADTEDPSRPTSSSSSKKRFSERIFSAARSLPGSVRAVVKGEDMTHQGDTAGAASQSSPNDDTPTSAKHYSTPIVRSEGPSDFGKQESRKGMILNELVRGVIGTSEWDVGYFVNISRISGLEARVALLIITPSNLHIVDGIQMQRDGHAKRLEWTEIVTQFSEKSKVVLTAAEVVASVSDHQKKAPSATGSSLKRLKSSDWAIDSDDEVAWMTKVWYQMLHSEYGYLRMPVDQVYTIFKRRYQLEHVAMEVTDVSGMSLHFACNSVNECEAVLKKLLDINMHQSLFHKVGLKNLQIAGGLFMYKRLMAYFLSNMTKLWQRGNISNLEYLMHLNAAAGRSLQDLTQYPVFPWVLADYESESLNLQNPASFRDLSRPMGALGEKRAMQYAERFRSMDEFYRDEVEGCPPPFFYGTHYSCAGYVLYYLMRMQPFARMAISLQGGQFDKPDRLFKSLQHSWMSASSENLQDVRELIPEFYFLPEFLLNSNCFELGETQKGDVVDDVQMPPWAGGDAREFIRLHRQALESKYVSENLHNWIDLIFGSKQRGKAAEGAMNVFIPLTYEGEVKLDEITDPMLREATLAQINNFGQTPCRLFSRPHPKRLVPDAVRRSQDGFVVDAAGIQWLEHMTPPLCVVGAPQLVWLNRVSLSPVLSPQAPGEAAPGVGDIRIVSRDRLIAVPLGCVFIPPKYVKFLRYGKTVGGISVHVAQSSPRHMEVDKEVSSHEQLHLRPVSCVAVSSDGSTIATGGYDRSVRIWSFSKQSGSRSLEHHATLCGHDGKILCLDFCSSYSIVVSGSTDRTAMVWDSRGAKLLRVLGDHSGPVLSVSVNAISGHIATVTAGELRVYTINGDLLCRAVLQNDQQSRPKARVVMCPPSGDWQDGVVAVTGHEGGHVFLWKLKISIDREGGDAKVVRELMSYSLTKVHRADITVLRLCPAVVTKAAPVISRVYNGECMYELVVGDAEGAASRWAPGRLDQLSPSELQQTLNHPNTAPSRLGVSSP